MNHFILIDDDEMINFIHQQVIFSVDPSSSITMFGSAEEGFNKLNDLGFTNRNGNFIVFVDINMPEINGFELLTRLESASWNYDHIHLFVVSSSLFEKDREQALSFPFVKGYKEKPLNKNDILNILEAFR
jgi:CheY-like chemotaxis protein